MRDEPPVIDLSHAHPSAKVTLAFRRPVPLLVASWPADFTEGPIAKALLVPLYKLGERLQIPWEPPLLRCVGLHRLKCVMETGVDVEPSDSVIWTDRSPQKVLEYGDTPGRIMLIFSSSKLEPSWREVDAASDPGELEALRRKYPTVLRSQEGSKLWFSRLPETDRRIGQPYEVAHGRYIPGDPWQALQAVMLFGPDHEALIQTARRIAAEIASPVWGC